MNEYRRSRQMDGEQRQNKQIIADFRLILPNIARDHEARFFESMSACFNLQSSQSLVVPGSIHGSFALLNNRKEVMVSSSVDDRAGNSVDFRELYEGMASSKAALSAESGSTRMRAAIPVFLENGNWYGIFGFIGRRTQDTASHELIRQVHDYGLACFNESTIRLQQSLIQSMSEEVKKQDLLIQSAQRLHSLIDTDAVLMEVIHILQTTYSDASLELYLSQDNQSSKLSVKPLDFQRMDNSVCTRAFMDGRTIVESDEHSSPPEMEVAAPLSGKQGVYGVVHLHVQGRRYAEHDIQFISMLADFGGASFENAKLYEQSYMLISELRLINEITQRLNQSLSLNEIFNFVSAELVEIFGAEYFSIMERDKDSDRLIVKASNLPDMFHHEFTIYSGFSGLMFATKEPIIISDYWINPKVDSKLMELTNSRSLIASPIIVKEEVVGAILVVHHKPNFFSYDNYKLLQMLSGHIGLAMTNASLHAEVKRMVITDNLTGLHVRHYLDEQILLSQKRDFGGSFILIDIDNFKKINDTYGHQVGDQVLVQVSAIIKQSIREHDIAARWGGEELAMYFPQITKEQALRIIDRIRKKVMVETNPPVTISCGLSDWNWEQENISVESLFYRADMAMYQAKNSGKNQIIVNSMN